MLEAVRKQEPSKAPLVKEINALLEFIRQPGAQSVVNRGIGEAKKSVAAIKGQLRELKKPTAHDLFLRERALEKLEEAEAALVPDPLEELAIRISQIQETMKAKFDLKPTDALKEAIKLIDEMNEGIAIHHFSQLRQGFNDQTSELSTGVAKREWITSDQTVVSSYIWNKNKPNQDPHFKSNETHVGI